MPVKELSRSVDDFIYKTFNKDQYARWVLMHFRLPAALKLDFDRFMAKHHLFCDHNGKRYRVTGASRFGDIYLQSDLTCDHGYDEDGRVSVDTCSNWGPTP